MNIDWQRVRTLFHAALERRPAERAAFLSRACTGDEALRAEVASLLDADSKSPSWMDDPIFAVACEILGTESEAQTPGRQIGHFRIERELGRGGMGTVYLAARDDGQFRQQVALKRIRSGLASDSIARRFRSERQILADLAHPNIARLLDGGMTENGDPYLVMEYVEGKPIDRYCEQHRLSSRRRLEIFLKVCAAVQHAHRHLVVHCDLKPGNILVTDEGEPKLLDFGVARLLAGETARGPGEGTAGGLRLMTPEYASPEQILGRPLATTSDVYSLGVLLYELLTGISPVRQAEPPRREAAPIARDAPPPSPSSPIEVAGRPAAERRRWPTRSDRTGRKLCRDLDSIALAALHEEPSRRYGSVEQLAADLRRYLTGQPVTARRHTPAYLAGKFIRRHRLAVAATALVALSLLVGLAVATFQAHEAERERSKAEQVTGFIKSLFRQVDPGRARGPDLTLGELLDDAVGPIRSGLAGQPRVQADLLQILGEGYTRLGRFEPARELLEQAMQIRRQTLGDEHPEVARSLDSLGLLALEQGDLPSAETLLRQALERSRERLGDRHLDVAESLNGLGRVLLRTDPAAAESRFRRSLAIRRETVGDRSREVSVSLNNLGVALQESQRTEEAREALTEALELRQQLFGERHLLVANSLHNLASVLTDLGELRSAERRQREALALYRARLGDDHGSTAAALHNLAGLLRAAGRVGEAREAVEEAMRINEQRQNPIELALNLMLSGALAYGEGDLAVAERNFARALALRRESLGVAPPGFADSLYSLVQVQRQSGSATRAEAELRAALAAWASVPPTRAWDVPYTEGQLGLVLIETGGYREAEERLRASISGLRQARRPDLTATFEPALAALVGPVGDRRIRSVRE